MANRSRIVIFSVVCYAIVAQDCRITKTYHMSEWELEWRANIDKWADNSVEWTQGCDRLQRERRRLSIWMELWRRRQLAMSQADVERESFSLSRHNKVFGYHAIYDTCRKSTILNVPLEPLVGFLRHPTALCFSSNKKTFTNKDYMLPNSVLEVWPRVRSNLSPFGVKLQGRSFFFDVGASLYDRGGGGASQSWFVSEYRKRGLDFNRIFAWEAKAYAPADLFDTFPPDVLDKLSYYNVPANATVGAAHNPLRAIRALATEDDFVVLKLDIDNGAVENSLLYQICEDPELAALIDELYWESHMWRNPLQHRSYWLFSAGPETDQPRLFSNISKSPYAARVKADNDITASYEIFHRLRELGIRAHSWV